MSGLLSYSRTEAAALPLTPDGVADVVAGTRRAVLGQLGLAVTVSAALLFASRATSGALALGFGGLGLISLWGVLATLLSAWDHARVSALLGRHVRDEIARETDPVKFWRLHRGLFPYLWS